MQETLAMNHFSFHLKRAFTAQPLQCSRALMRVLSLSLRTNRTMWPLTYPSRHCMCHHQLVHLLARMRQCAVDRNARIFKHFSTFLFSFHSSSYSTTAIRTSCSRRQIRLVRTDISSFARPAISYWAHVHTPDRMFSRRCRNYDRH